MKHAIFKKSLVGFFFILNATKAPAMTGTATDVSDMCERMAAKHEVSANIPDHILHGIVRTESASHPWTVNFQGKGFYFDTKEEAMEFVQNLIDRGYRSIDVGCAQINLKWHPDAFANLEDAFDPDHNLAYAAEFLKTIRYEYGAGDWYAAVGKYHNGDPERGRKYANIVYRKINLAPPQVFMEDQLPENTSEVSVRISTKSAVHSVENHGPHPSEFLAPKREGVAVAIADPTYFMHGITFEQLVSTYHSQRVSQMDGVIGNMKN